MSTTNQPSLRNLASGDVLFREGEVGDFAYQVVKGKIEICKFNGDDYVTLSTLEKGSLFGEMALIDKQPRSAMARAIEESVVKEIDQDALLTYLKNSPQTAFNMMQQLQVMQEMQMKSYLLMHLNPQIQKILISKIK